MSRSFERLRLLQLQAARAQVRLDELRALSTPSQEAYERAEARVQKEVAQRATRKVSSTPRRRLEQLDRMAELKRAALGRVKRLRDRLAAEGPDQALQRLVGKIESFELIDRRLKHLARTTKSSLAGALSRNDTDRRHWQAHESGRGGKRCFAYACVGLCDRI